MCMVAFLHDMHPRCTLLYPVLTFSKDFHHIDSQRPTSLVVSCCLICHTAGIDIATGL